MDDLGSVLDKCRAKMTEMIAEGKRYRVMTETRDPLRIGDQCLWLNGDAKGPNNDASGKLEFFNGRVHGFGTDITIANSIRVLIS